jgi:hypothetical protein
MRPGQAPAGLNKLDFATDRFNQRCLLEKPILLEEKPFLQFVVSGVVGPSNQGIGLKVAGLKRLYLRTTMLQVLTWRLLC